VKKCLDVFVVAGARPNFMKVAPVLDAMKRNPESFRPVFVHTGQHYDDKMSKAFLTDLGLPDPDVSLGVGSASHAVQTARIMVEFEKAVSARKCDLVAVVGDVNSTLACALVAAKLHIPVAHVEAGLRSRDRTMPEEINRVVADHLSDILFTTCKDGGDNLISEGVPGEKIHFVGNVMIESLIRNAEKIDRSAALKRMELAPGRYALLTLHRPSNVDDPAVLKPLFGMLRALSKRIPVVFPVHPRTQAKIREFKLTGADPGQGRLVLTEPLDYFDFLCLEKNARLALTDSGGVQEETTYFGVPCLTLRENTERPVTIEQGTNALAGTKPEEILRACEKALEKTPPKNRIPEFWDKDVSDRIISVLRSHFGLN
jgi:UDP-N-acetylglucosamine 2-epimerase (non-hydrolysing)